MITSEIWAWIPTLEEGHVNALHSDVGTRRRTEQGGSHTCACAKLQDDSFSLAGNARNRCTEFSSLGSLRRPCELFEGRRRGRAPRWAMADVSHRCSPSRWESMTQPKRSSGTFSRALDRHLAFISRQRSAKGYAVLGTWRGLALFWQRGDSAGIVSRAPCQLPLRRCASSNGIRRGQCSGLRWMVLSFLSWLIPDTCAASSQRQSTSSCGHGRCGTNRERAHSKALLGTPPDCTSHVSESAASTRRQIFSWLISRGLFGLCSGSTSAPAAAKSHSPQPACDAKRAVRTLSCTGNVFNHPNEAAKQAHQRLSRRAQREAVDTPCLWFRGLLPASHTTGILPPPASEAAAMVFGAGGASTPGYLIRNHLYWYIDGSGGKYDHARLVRAGWGRTLGDLVIGTDCDYLVKCFHRRWWARKGCFKNGDLWCRIGALNRRRKVVVLQGQDACAGSLLSS